MCDIHIVTTRCPTPPFPFPMTPLRGHRVPFFGLAQHAVLPEKGYPKLAGSFVDMWHSEPCKLPSRLCRRILCASRYIIWHRGLVLCEAPNPSPIWFPPPGLRLGFCLATTKSTLGKYPS